MSDAILHAARAWRDQDPDPATRAELDALIAATAAGDPVATADLAERFSGRLAFGTAGLRGELGAGPMRMNRVLVAQAAAGLARYLLDRASGAGAAPSVVIGFDARHNSEVFARDTATIMAGAGIRAILLPRALPTPVLAFAVRHLGTSAGVMVTASHNPPRDNGYKVYLGGEDGGSQIVSPADAEIAARIAEAAERPIGELPRTTDFLVADDEVVDAYVTATAAVGRAGADPGGDAHLRVVYTPLHGVGLETFHRVVKAAGLPSPIVVAEQAEPDPDFPTVAFPNPEEPGALDLAFETARAESADLVVANDPDADRLAVAVPDPGAEGGWRRLTGNEIGLLLAWAAAEEFASAVPGRAADGVLAASIVSSPGLRAVAEAHGLGYAETLTGFKWISRVPGLVFGYEEALGYLVNPATVRDKDGLSAAARFIALASRWKADGSSVDEQLDALAARIGGHASGQVSIRVAALAEIGAFMSRLRESPPASIAGLAVERVDDLSSGASGLPPSDVLRFTLAGGSRVMVRPSGTEPKLKLYLDAVSFDGSGGERRRRAAESVGALEAGVRSLLGA